LTGCIARLEQLGLVCLADYPAKAVPSELRDSLVAGEPNPVVELYDDLASVILADPIHDVDSQAGWPNVNSKV
jgi:hypothetical protein